jgi:hypothetical protein
MLNLTNLDPPIPLYRIHRVHDGALEEPLAILKGCG